VNGGTPPSGDPAGWDGDIPFITPPDLGSLDGALVGETSRTITETGAASSGTAPAGSVILSTRAPIGYVGRIAHQSSFNQGCRAITPNDRFSDRFLAYALIAARDEMELRGQGTTFLELSAGALAGLPIPMPSPQQQGAISDFLDRETAQIDAFIAKSERLIALFAERRQTVADTEVFGGGPGALRALSEKARSHAALAPVLEALPSGWGIERWKALLLQTDERNEDGEATMMSLKSTGEIVERATLGQRQEPDESSIPRYYITHPGDLVVNPMWLVGGSIGVSQVTGAVSPDYRVFRSQGQHDPAYLHHLLRSHPYRDQYVLFTRAETTFDRRVQQPDLDNMPLPVPPMAEQAEIARRIDDAVKQIDAAMRVAERGITLVRERRAALISAAVTGQISANA
jgi:type I restriction enzyme S subunit